LRSKKNERKDFSLKKDSHRRWDIFSLTLTLLYDIILNSKGGLKNDKNDYPSFLSSDVVPW
jgi:hypothetical protein